MKLFGTNGIRGIANDYLSCDKLVKIGMAIAKILGSKSIAIAMDTRISSDMIRSAVSAGILSMGCDIINLGMIPTPALQYYVKTHENISGGVMITASHNPPEYNGVKCISSDGTECSPEEEKSIEHAFDLDLQTVPWNEIGTEKLYNNAGDDYVESIVSKTNTDLIRKANLTVCIDCANGAASFTTPLLLKKIGVKTISLNSSPDGMFPGHYSEPIEANLSELKKIVVNTKADLGAAHDGDADRCVFITDKGNYLTGDVSLALLSKEAIRNSDDKRVVTTVATSSMVSDTAKKAGGSVKLTAVGSPLVAREMMNNGGVIGGEDNGGIIFANHQYCRDGAMALVKMMELIANNGSLEKQVSKLPKYHTIKYVMQCDDQLKQKILTEFEREHKKEKLDKTDGLRINYSDGWVILRPSGTESKFRITSESKKLSTAESLANKFKIEYEIIYEKLKK